MLQVIVRPDLQLALTRERGVLNCRAPVAGVPERPNSECIN
jgi:hypothetical protein